MSYFINSKNVYILLLAIFTIINSASSQDTTTQRWSNNGPNIPDIKIPINPNKTNPIDNINTTKDVINTVNSIPESKISISKINKNHNKLIISIAGSGVWANAKDHATSEIETLLKGEGPSTTSDYGDMIYKKSTKFLYDEETVAVIGFPWFSTKNGAISPDLLSSCDDTWWGPTPEILAKSIRDAVNLMKSEHKLILIGKSMGGCKLQQIVMILSDYNIIVDLLILVDASCTLPYDQSNLFKPVYNNVKKVFNFHQTSDWPIDADFQNGFQISFSSPTEGQNIDVTNYNSYMNTTMCSGVGHDDIDECQVLLDYIDKIVNAELKSNLNDFSSILNLLLD